MAKKKARDSADATEPLTFEAALQRLEEIVHELEEGRIGLSDALTRYEQGVAHLRQCHQLLEQAERKIELLVGVDEEGKPIAQPYDEQELSLEEKAKSRGKRRTHPGSARRPPS